MIATGRAAMKTRHLLASQFALGFAAVLSLAGCIGGEARVQIISASISGDGATSNDRISVRLDAEDVMVLAEQEIYSHIVVFECDNDAVRYPASPRLGEVPMDDFNALRRALRTRQGDRTIDIQGDILRSFLNRLTRICVKMEGGSYMGRTLRSNLVAVNRSR